MKAPMIEPLLRNATIKAIDGISRKVNEVETGTETLVTRLLRRWNELDAAEKENVVAIAIATASTAVTAIAAMRRGPKKALKKAGKRVVKKVTRKAL